MEIMLIVVLFVLLGVFWYYKEKAEEEYIKACIERGDIVIQIHRR